MASTESIPALRLDDIPKQALAAGSLDVSALTGTWLNTDRGRDGGVHKLLIAEGNEDGMLQVHGFGVADPEPIDWESTDAPAFAFAVDDDTAWGFRCEFEFGFLSTEIAGYGKEGILIIVTYNTFHDDSGRADYWIREFFHREDA